MMPNTRAFALAGGILSGLRIFLITWRLIVMEGATFETPLLGRV